MKRGILVLLSLSVVITGAYFTASKWAIRHETLMFKDPTRDERPVAVDVAVRFDKEMQADALALSRAMLDDIDAATRLQLVRDHLDQAWAKAITRSVAMVEVATRGLNPASASSLPERPVSAPRAGDDLAA